MVERFVQLLDDLDDLLSMALLLGEPLRKALIRLLATAVMLAIQIGGVLLALSQPPLALAAALLMFVGLLYRAATGAHQPLEIA